MCERKLVEDLEGMVARWTKASQIGEFLMAVSDAFPEDERVPEVAWWLVWVSGTVRQLDPLSDPFSVPKIVEPDRLPSSDAQQGRGPTLARSAAAFRNPP